jgi:hypothetical protein
MKARTGSPAAFPTNLALSPIRKWEVSMQNRQAMTRLSDRLLQHATVSLAIMGLLLACAPVDRTTKTQDSAQAVEAVDDQNRSLPDCNVADNRDDAVENDCTNADNEVNAIILKVATKAAEGIEKGTTFFCQCGNVKLETREDSVPGNLDELESIAIASQNSTCLVWSRVGGKKKCVVEALD